LVVLSGYQVEVDAEHTALIQGETPFGPLDPRYYYFDNDYFNSYSRYMVNFMQDTQTAYPGLTELVDIGDAWQGQNGGYLRDMWVLRITNEDPAYGSIADKPAFFVMSDIHAREVTTPELAVRWIKYLTAGYNGLGGYGLDADVTWLVNHHVMYILVTQNPDGHRVDEEDINFFRRKNMDNNDGCIDPGTWGVDLNRNHSFLWGCCGGSSGSPCSETYRGPTGASEPETAAYQDYIFTIIPDQNGLMTTGRLPRPRPSPPPASSSACTPTATRSWPWFLPGYPSAPNQNQMQDIGRKMAAIDSYYDPTGSIGYTVDGPANYWTYGKLGIPAFTFETGPQFGSCGDFFPAFGCQDGTDGMPRNFWAENRPVFLYMAKIARQPFWNVYGPDANALAVNPSTVYPGDPVQLTATVADQRYGGDLLATVTAAEYFMDAPGADGAGYPMTPSDGSWGETSEAVQATLDTSGLSIGQHYILVHGQGDNLEWGPFTAIFLWVESPDYRFALAPETAGQRADPGQVLTYTLTITNSGLNADTYDLAAQANWPTSLPATFGPLNPGQSASFDVLVTIPLSATHGESDTATITATSQGAPARTAQAELTSLANAYGLSLDPAYTAAEGYPGGQILYPIQVANLGNLDDAFAVSATSPWDVSFPNVVGPLAPGAAEGMVVTVTVPLSALPGDSAPITVTLTSQGNPAFAETVALTATALYRGPLVSPLSDQGAGDPGAIVTYTLSVTNSGETTETFIVSIEQAAWPTSAPANLDPLQPDEATSLQVTVTVPLTAAAGASDQAILRISSPTPGVAAATALLETSANVIYGLELSPDSASQVVDTVAPVTYTLWLTNAGNITDTFIITSTSV
jgi:hypothetical protein